MLYKIYSLVGLQIGNLIVYISCFILTLFPYFLTCIHKSVLTLICLMLPFICCIHWNTYLCSYFLKISYIYFCFKVFCCLLLLVGLFTFHLQHSNTCNQHHIYNIFEKISSCHDFNIFTSTAPTCDTNNKERCFRLPYFSSRVCLH